MKSANIHNPLYEYQFVGSSSSLATSTHAWNTLSSMLSTNSSSSSYPNFETSSLNQGQEENTCSLLNSHSYSTTSMAPDTSFNYWSIPNFVSIQSAEDLQISRIKEELSDIHNLNYSELISSSPSSSSNDQESSQLLRSEQRINHLQLPNDHHLNTKLLLKSFSSGNLANKDYEGDPLLDSSNGARGYTQLFTSVPVSSLLNQTAGFSTSQGPSLDMNLEALDLLSSSRFSGSFMNSSLENFGMLRDGFSYGFGHRMQQQSHHQFPIYNSINYKMPSCSSNGAAEAKRNSSKMDSSKPINQTSIKKPRLEARASCPPLKVRKEKLGDRIASLQQLVAPFGKTDTASVLMEAIGYIKFLQNQVETLSVPYMKSHRSIKDGHIENLREDEEEEEKGPKCSLKSRGLCLVPMSCISYISDGGGGGGAAAVWPPSHLGGTTERY